MGVDISFFKTPREVYEETRRVFDNEAEDIDWTPLEKYQVNWACGRHFMYDTITSMHGSEQMVLLTRKDLKEISEEARKVTSMWRAYNDELVNIPVSLLKKYLKQAEEEGSEMITFELEERDISDNLYDDTDYYQASNFLECNWKKDPEEVIWYFFSY